MGVGDVVVGVLFGCVESFGEVEVEVGVEGAHDEKIAGDVHREIVDEGAQGDELAAALAHPDGLAAFEKVHLLGRQDAEAFGVETDGGKHGFEAFVVAVVVGAEDVADIGESAPDFGMVIGDVGHEIGGAPVATNDDPVLVVAVIGGAKEYGSVFAFVEGRGYGLACVRDSVAFVQGALAEKVVEANPEIPQVFFGAGNEISGGPFADFFRGLGGLGIVP